MSIALSDTTFDVLPYNSGVSRYHTYTVNDALVVTWLASNGPPTFSESVVYTVVAMDGTILIPETRIEFPDTNAPNGFGDHVTHVSPDGSGGYIFYMTHAVYGYVEDGIFVPPNSQPLAVNIDASGSVVSSTPLDFFLPLWENSSTVELEGGGFAMISAGTTTARVTVVDADGNLVNDTVIDGTFGNGGPFVGATDGLDIVEVGGRLLALHIDSATDEVFGQFFTLAGISDSAEFQISVGDHTQGSFAAVFEDGHLEATLLTDGRVAVVYANGLNGQIDVFATVLNADGSVSIPEFQVNTGPYAAGEQYHANVHALDGGGFAVTWNQNLVFSAVPGGFIQEYSANGTPIGDVIGVGTGTGSGVGYGSIQPDGSGLLSDWYGNITVLEGGSGGGGGGSGGGGGGGGGGGTPPGTVIDGTDGNDTLIGTAGNDTFNGGLGFDIAVIGAAFADVANTVLNPNGSLTIDSTRGTDTAFDIALFDFLGTIVTADALLNPFSTTPTNGVDLLTGDDRDDRFDGGDGNDTLIGGAGDDGLKGDDGDDLLVGGPGNDRLPGGNGNDISYGGAGDDRLGGGFGDDYMDGGDGNDGGGAGPGDDTVIGGAGNDQFNGGYGSDYIDLGDGDDRSGASFGNDTVFGGAGNDLLTGGDGNDDIHGDAGNDTINSGYGDDTVTGGDGADLFIFNSLFGGDLTVITDFEDGIDTIRVTGLRPAPDELGRLDITDITYQGAAAASFTYASHTVIVQGVSAADLTADDFIFG